VKIVGIIDRNSGIIYQSNRSGSVDYHMLFSNMAGETENLDEISYIDNMTCFIPETFFVSKKNLDSVQEQYVSLEAEENLSENYENVLRTEKTIFRTELNGVVMIVMKQNGSTEALAYNRNRIAQISQFDFLHDLSYIKKNTWHNIMANISDMIPIGAGMILFTMISFVTLSTLMYQKNMRKYSIYYMYGLTWRNIFWIHILYISLLALAALALGTVLLYGAGYFGIWKAAVQLGAVQLAGCLMVILLLLLAASLMCISLVRGRTAKKILQGVE
jgi:ABC-type multidrug transport system permease subunit